MGLDTWGPSGDAAGGYAEAVLFLERIDEAYRQQLLAVSREVTLQAGEFLVRREASGQDLFWVEQGSVEVLDRRTSPEVVLQVLGPGTLVGELGGRHEVPRTADVRAVGPVVCRAWERAGLRTFLRENGELAAQFYRALAELLGKRSLSLVRQSEGLSSLKRVPQAGADFQQEAHALVAPARAAWIRAEQVLLAGGQNPEHEKKLLRRALEELLRDACRWITGKGSPEAEQAAGAVLAQELHPFLVRARCGALSQERRSEARRMAHILSEEAAGTDSLGELLDQLLLRLPTAAALRRRTSIVAQDILASLPPRYTEMVVLNTGTSVVLNRVVLTLARHGAMVTCIDDDREALAAVDMGLSSMPRSVSMRLVCTDLAALAMGRTDDQHAPQDLIFVDGLVDALPDPLVASLLMWCKRHLKPGGRVLLTGVAPAPDAPLFDHLLDWPLIRRPARELRALVESVGLTGAVVLGDARVPAVVVAGTR